MRHPFFYAMVRLRTRATLRSQGYNPWQVNDLMDATEDDLIDVAAVQAQVTVPPTVGELGDGAILKAIIDFLKSEQGQALIKALITLLLSLIAI